MENSNVGGGKDQMPQDRRKEQEAGKKAGQQSQGGSSQNWQPHDKSGSQRPGGSGHEGESNREGRQPASGGQSSQSGQRDQSSRPGQSGNQPK